MNNNEKNVARQVARLNDGERERLLETPDKDLADTLRELGISLPASNWWLVAVKIILYGLGLVLAGLGTAQAATIVGLTHMYPLINSIN